MKEGNDGERATMEAISDHRCRLFKFGTAFVVDGYGSAVLVRVHAVGARAPFWASGLFVFDASGKLLAPEPRHQRVARENQSAHRVASRSALEPGREAGAPPFKASNELVDPLRFFSRL
jgi:hypothetical protein